MRVAPRLKWMQFIDGENFSMSAQRGAQEQARVLSGGYFVRDSLFWIPGCRGNSSLAGSGHGPEIEPHALRSHYYTSTVGGEDIANGLREQLRGLGFEPRVFKRDRSTKRSKGVDIALTRDMLSHAFRDNYEAVILIAGDGDYLPLIEEVQRLGKWVWVQFFVRDMNPALRLAADQFSDLTHLLRRFPVEDGSDGEASSDATAMQQNATTG